MGSGQSLSACYRTWKARGRPASRRTSSTVDVLALRHSLQWDGGDGGTMAKKDAVSKRLALEIAVAKRIKKWREGRPQEHTPDTPQKPPRPPPPPPPPARPPT